MDNNKEQTLSNFLKTLLNNKLPMYVYVNENRYSYNSLVSDIDIENVKLYELNQKIVFVGDSWYIKNWELFTNKYNLSQKNKERPFVMFDKDNIGNLFEHDIPNSLVFCESCENLIKKDELRKLHSCKRCSMPPEYCRLSDKKKKKQTGNCKNYHSDEDDQQELCEECLSIKIEMEDHPGSFWGVDDEDYDDAFHSWFEND
jgi:hypothetical protein